VAADILIIAGFLLTAFFAGTETALVSMNWLRLENWLEKGRRGARTVERFVGDPQRLLGTTLVGTNIAVIMTSSLISWRLATTLTSWPTQLVGAVSTLTSALAILVLGEIIPKAIGLRHSDAITLKVIHPLRAFYWVLSPVIVVVSAVARGLNKMLGVDARQWSRRLTKDQLRSLLANEGERAGAVDKEGTELISGIFEFAVTSVGEVMVPRTDIVGVSLESTVGDAVSLVREHGFSRLPLLSEDRDRIEGMIHSRDLLGRPGDERVEALARPIPHVPATKTCDDLFRELQASRQHMAVVVDENGSLAGIVTLEDLIEELVGEIEDEHDVRHELIQKIDDGLYMVDGRAGIEAVAQALGAKIPDGDYNTIAGFVLAVLGRIPEPGDEVVVGGLEMRVVSASATRVGKIRIRKRWNPHREGQSQDRR
jgi:CBS domain containing-hemolysin-like protein